MLDDFGAGVPSGGEVPVTRRVLGFLLPFALLLAAVATMVGAQEGAGPCQQVVAGTGTGKAVQPTAEDAVGSVFPELRASLPPPTAVGTVTEFEYDDGGFITVERQSNGKYIVDHYVMCAGRLQ